MARSGSIFYVDVPSDGQTIQATALVHEPTCDLARMDAEPTWTDWLPVQPVAP